MKLNEQTLATFASGMMAGLGATLTFVAVPAINACNDPLPVWKRVYKNGGKIAIASNIITTFAGIRCYFKTEDIWYLIMAGTIFTIIPYTFLFMMPTNNALMAIEDSACRSNKEAESKVRKLIGKWDKLQYGRTALGLGAFFINVCIVLKAVS